MDMDVVDDLSYYKALVIINHYNYASKGSI